jgi:hypothetical protein
MPLPIVRVAVTIGAIVDLGVAILAIFLQPLLGPLLDVPTKDPALTTIAGGEFFVVTLVYVVLLRDMRRYRILLWIVALDQFFAGILPGFEIARGAVAATWKTIGPIPFNLALGAIYVAGALRSEREF